MEKKIVQRICPGQPIKLIGVNGDHVKIEAVCSRLETHIRLLGNRHYPIIVVFDREKREESAIEIAVSVIEILNDKGFNSHDIRVFVADRQIEDWLLLDIEGICQHYSVDVPAGILQGKGGIARLLQEKTQYHETTVGVEIFGIVSKSKLRDGCPSFGALYATAVELGCAGFE